MQVDTRERGFSYAYDAPLDMRMDPAQELTAAELVNTWDRRRLARVLREYGEERYADRIAGADRRAAARSTPRSSSSTRSPPRSRRPRGSPAAIPAKRTFQAIRIAVNDELAQLDAALPLAWDVLRVGGRLAAISFHSLEDRRVKRFLADKRARLHLPARPAGLRAAAARREAELGVPPLGRADARRGRRQPALEVGPPAGRPQAQGGALVPPQTAAPAARHARRDRAPPASGAGTARAASPARCARAGAARPRAVRARHDRRLRAHPRAPRAPRASTACCAAARGSG